MHGFLLIDKSAGLTSNDVLIQLKKRFNVKSMGHGGTLDPFATGLLMVGVSEATKFFPYLNLEPKGYKAVIKFGEKTDTLDKTGQIISHQSVPDITESQISSLFSSLLGEQTQIPPMYSAKQIRGKRLYALARQGLVVERKPVQIVIHKMELCRYEKPYLTFCVSCSTGTYVRSLGETIAESLQTLGHLVSLSRVSLGKFDLKKSVKLEEDFGEEKIISLKEAFQSLPQKHLSKASEKKIYNGQGIPDESCHGEDTLVVLLEGFCFIGLGRVKQNQIWPCRLVVSG